MGDDSGQRNLRGCDTVKHRIYTAGSVSHPDGFHTVSSSDVVSPCASVFLYLFYLLGEGKKKMSVKVRQQRAAVLDLLVSDYFSPQKKNNSNNIDVSLNVHGAS